MKLKNKRTGKIGYLYEHSLAQDIIIVYDVKGIVGKYKSITELCEEWEDAPEEPKKHYEILAMGAVMGREDAEDEIFRNQGQREIGNYFETEEEAEKAVEKLKAWKRLKDKGSKIIDYEYYGGTNTKGEFSGEVKVTIGVSEVDKYLFNLLFGGEE